MDYDEYLKQASEYQLVPVWDDWLADTLTPIDAYWKLGAGPGSFLLESAEGERLTRYSFIGRDPWLSLSARGRDITIVEDGRQQSRQGSSLAIIRELFSRYRVPWEESGHRFWGGGVGYFGYDWVRNLERLPSLATDDLGMPDCWLMLPRQLLIFDHWRHSLRVAVFTQPGSHPEEAFNTAKNEISEIAQRLKTASVLPSPGGGVDAGLLQCNLTPQQYMEAVLKAKEYIMAGDIFQAVLSQRWELPFAGHPLAVYRALRYINPSPYMFYLDFGPLQLVGSSPEMLVKVEDGRVETNPIAGTRPRGLTADADSDLEAELLADDKEKAEHVMLVDLGRNDLGRVAEVGSVHMEQFMEIEKYSHVMHLVSRVQGKVADGHDALEVLAACFPAGTVSGAPKVRAMEIIEELEPVRRGCYAGAVGYLSFSGNLDTCLAIRTLVFQGGKAYIQAGAGIVAGSRPEAEYQETVNKAHALLRALQATAGNEMSLVG